MISFLLLLSSCVGSRHGLLEVHELENTALGKPMAFSVLRAPQLDGVDPSKLPVVLMLHGMGDDHRALDRYKVAEMLRKGMEDGSIPPVHIILPDGERGFYVNWRDGTHPYQDYILNDVLPAGESVLGISPGRENRQIMGFSMGGQGAVNIGLAHPELFSGISSFSTMILDRETARELLSKPLIRMVFKADEVWGDGTDEEYSRSMDVFLKIESMPTELESAIFLSCGSDDRDIFLTTMADFHKSLELESWKTVYRSFDGGHGWKWWGPLIGEALVWQQESAEKWEQR